MPSFDFSYEYDGAGNRSKKIDNLTSEVTTYVYDSANQLISMEEPSGTTTFEWDAAGNMIAKHAPEGTTTYTWDYRNRLTQVAPPVGDPINFAYNAMGQRIQKNGTRFIFDGVQLLQETDLNNQPLRSNTFTNEGYGDLVSENDGTDSSFPTFNGQSSTDAIVNKTATVTDRISYSAFGGQDSHTGSSTTPFRFVGKQSYYRDAETGLYLLGAGGNPNGAGRYYDPSLGRFISRDPIGLAGRDVNLYRYAGNNPVNGIDATGTTVCKCVTTTWSVTGYGGGSSTSSRVVQVPGKCSNLNYSRYSTFGGSGGGTIRTCSSGDFSTDEITLIGFCKKLAKCPSCNVPNCEKRVADVLNTIAETEVLGIRAMVIGKLLGFDAHCVAWTNKFFDREKSKPNIDGACITLRQKTIDVPFRPREEHSIILLTSGCGKLKSYIGIDNGFLGGSDGLFELGVQTDSDGSQLPAITMEQLEEVPRIDGYPIKIDEYTYERK